MLMLPHDAADLSTIRWALCTESSTFVLLSLNALRHMAPAFRPKPAALKLCRTAPCLYYTLP